MSTNRNLNQFKNALILHINDTFYEKPHNNFKRYIILSLISIFSYLFSIFDVLKLLFSIKDWCNFSSFFFFIS